MKQETQRMNSNTLPSPAGAGQPPHQWGELEPRLLLLGQAPGLREEAKAVAYPDPPE